MRRSLLQRAARAALSTMALLALMAGAAAPALAQRAAAQQTAQQTAPEAEPAVSEESHIERIAAVVNDDVVTATDLEARLRLAIIGAGLPNRQEVRQRLGPQVLRSLIEEQLQLQEARKLKIEVTREEIDKGFATLAEQNKLDAEQFSDVLKRSGVPRTTMDRQIRAQLGWNKIVGEEIRPKVQVAEDEITQQYQRMLASRDRDRYRVAEIFISTDRPGDDSQAQRLVEQMYEEIQRGGSFAAIARQVSRGPTAEQGGELGWIEQGQLEPEVEKALTGMKPGDLSRPIRSQIGWHMVLLQDMQPGALRAAARQNQPEEPLTVNLKQIVIPVPEGNQQLLAERLRGAEVFSREIDTCPAFEARMKQMGGPGSGDMGRMKVADLAPGIQQMVSQIPIGRVSPPLRSPFGITLIVVCDRNDQRKAPPEFTREDVGNQMYLQRIDMMQRRYLRDLRAAAYVDIRV